jgi:hypothetical protein
MMMKRLFGLVAAAAFAVACGQTDAGITTAVKTKLAADDTVKAYQVDVDTQNHVVTLSGDVETETQKAHAVQLARETDGVRDVIDQLRVNPTAATSGRVDADGADIDVNGDVNADVDDDAEANAREGASAVKEGAKKGADAVVDGAKKVGSEIKDAVTDDDRDSDNDGK